MSNTKLLLIALTSVILGYFGSRLALKAVVYQRITMQVGNADCKKLFVLAADPNMMTRLNSRISFVHVFNKEEKAFSVEYGEQLEHSDLITNVGIGHFKISRESSDEWLIRSSHNVCLFSQHLPFCMLVSATQKFGGEFGNDCVIVDAVKSECPVTLVEMCKAEMGSQRAKVLRNLIKIGQGTEQNLYIETSIIEEDLSEQLV